MGDLKAARIKYSVPELANTLNRIVSLPADFSAIAPAAAPTKRAAGSLQPPSQFR